MLLTSKTYTMPLTPRQIQLIKTGWRSLGGIDPRIVADLFYTKLFTDHPALRNLFPKNMEQQHLKLMNMLTAIISRLDHPENIHEEITAMGKRHEGYGVKPHHYKLVGDALLWTLEKGLGNNWTEEMKTAWISCYDHLSSGMQS